MFGHKMVFATRSDAQMFMDFDGSSGKSLQVCQVVAGSLHDKFIIVEDMPEGTTHVTIKNDRADIKKYTNFKKETLLKRFLRFLI